MTADLLEALEAARDVADATIEVNTGLDVTGVYLFAVATDGSFDFVQSSTPTAPTMQPATAENLAARLRSTADSIGPPPPELDLARAANVVHYRAKAAGMAPGANRDVDLRPLLTGTDVIPDQLHGLADHYAHQVAGSLAALRDDSDNAADDFLGILAAFWKHAALSGVIAAQEARR